MGIQGVIFTLWNLKTLKKLLKMKIRGMLYKNKMISLRRTRCGGLFTSQKTKRLLIQSEFTR